MCQIWAFENGVYHLSDLLEKQVRYFTTELSQSALSFTVHTLHGPEMYVIFISLFFHGLASRDGNVLHLPGNQNDFWIKQ